ncbi:hypothetical protein [Methanohalophilus portucalensis]|uniref:Uncharacterized protein n=2 Tax=Methanohalophilus portucalensis TaxID=39664 RepID=A0A1L9C6X6_9EURY|nr:hypothetical protein [Methanohalophilus portucalensis]ATU08838.1 hypothetical protein BKM01_08690 [Methanohalophilus portucalensis]OJH50234.1 hypothetical protein MPF_0022 [Methanohalophilus portucalensis FDF-1]RNI11316.1 hypothetical protein EFE41_07135 [Methanohalophilus portucalensis FDF-1]SMH28085.1 hypothetical protein SAMN06264941_0022 [Methanohalophilus portucalensis FDF-1]
MKLKIQLFIAFIALMAMSVGGVLAEDDCQKTVTLYAGQDIDVGIVNLSEICVDNQPTLKIIYEVDVPWRIAETHLEVADDPNELPQKNGNPIPGQFTYKDEWESYREQVTYEVPLESCNEVFIAAHAVVVNHSSDDKKNVWDVTETAWADGEDFDGNNWATYFNYTPCCIDCGGEQNFEENTDVDDEKDKKDKKDKNPGNNGKGVGQSMIDRIFSFFIR